MQTYANLLEMSVYWSVCRSEGWSVSHNFLKQRELHLHAPIGALVYMKTATLNLPNHSEKF